MSKEAQMQVVYAQEEAPNPLVKSIFLVGPTPRNQDVASWRPAALRALEICGYNGTVFVPEPRSGWGRDYYAQVEWEKKHLEMADVILAWVPRDLQLLPAFTTNVEFGRYMTSGKILYGRPDGCPNNSYLDWMYEDHGWGKPLKSLIECCIEATKRLGGGSERKDGQRYVPLHIWKTPMFQNWHQQLGKNRLEEAKLLWSFYIHGKNFLFSYVLWVKVWIEDEQRFKDNEYVFTRSDISVILPYCPAAKLLDTKIVMIREFRSPARNSTGYVHELPGGSSFKEGESVTEIAAHELKEETGLDIASERFKLMAGRQLAATLSTHKAVLFTVELSEDEIANVGQTTHGVVEDTERTHVEVRSLRDVILTDDTDWSMLGMMFNGIADSERIGTLEERVA
jgi:ADP-ribose pyrophosphatase YjhB (NUDIX family)